MSKPTTVGMLAQMERISCNHSLATDDLSVTVVSMVFPMKLTEYLEEIETKVMVRLLLREFMTFF